MNSTAVSMEMMMARPKESKLAQYQYFRLMAKMMVLSMGNQMDNSTEHPRERTMVHQMEMTMMYQKDTLMAHKT